MANWQLVNGVDSGGPYRQLCDLETGQVQGAKIRDKVYQVADGQRMMPVDPTRSRKAFEKEPYFYRIYRTNWVDIVRKKRLTMQERGVLASLLVCLSWESTYLVHPDSGEVLSLSKLADVLVTDRKQLGKTMDALRAKGLVATIDRGEGREYAYQLNSHVMFYGRMMRDINQHKVFDECAYEPVRRKEYRQRAQVS
jgi:hypothetical protein